MRALLYLAIMAGVIAAVVWVMERAPKALASRKRAAALPPSGGQTGSLVAQARLVSGLEAGPGQLRLTPTQLVFAADSGRVLVIERIDIVGAGATRQLPDRTVARPVLAVSTATDVLYFDLDQAGRWERLLLE